MSPTPGLTEASLNTPSGRNHFWEPFHSKWCGMPLRSLLAVLFCLSALTPLAAAPPQPVLVLQAQPLGRLLGDLKELVRLTAAPGADEAAVRALVKGLEEAVGEKGFEGIDLDRPLAVFAALRDKQENHTLTLVVPVTTEKDFLDLIDRSGGRATPVEGKKGLFKLDLPADIFANQSHVRIADGWAYLEFNGDQIADPANLVPVANLIDPKETAALVLRVFPDRVPAKMLKATLDEIQHDLGQFKQFFPPDEAAVKKAIDTFIDEGLKLFRRTAETLHADAKAAAVRFHFDAPTGDASLAVTVTPKPGTPLAKDVAARAPSAHRFAGLVQPDAALGYVWQWPLFSPESRAIVAAELEMNLADLKKDVPEAAHPAIDELFKGLGRSAKAGDIDMAAAVYGPDKAGLFTAVAAVSCDDAPAVEKALRALAKKLPVQVVAFDADKAEGVSIHRVMIPLEGNAAEFQPAFGKVAPLCVAFGPGAVYLGFGPEAMDRVKAALAVKPGPSPVASVTGVPARLTKLAGAAAGPKAGKFFGALIGTDGKPATGLTVTLAGGSELTLRVGVNVKYIPRLIVNADGDDIGKP